MSSLRFLYRVRDATHGTTIASVEQEVEGAALAFFRNMIRSSDGPALVVCGLSAIGSCCSQPNAPCQGGTLLWPAVRSP
jgi:hypothetical protein